jgi:hypothetical protein
MCQGKGMVKISDELQRELDKLREDDEREYQNYIQRKDEFYRIWDTPVFIIGALSVGIALAAALAGIAAIVRHFFGG